MTLEHSHGVSHDAKISGAREARGPGAHDRDPFPGALPGLEELELLLEHVVRGMPLQQRDLDRLLVAVVQDTRSFAQHFYRTGARARVAERVRIEDDSRGAAQVAGRDLLDECRDVDMCGAGNRARAAVAVGAWVRPERGRVVG